MRTNILFAIVIVLSVISLLRPKLGVYFYMWFALMRPEVLAWANGYAFSAMIAAATFVGTIRHYERVRELFVNPITFWMLMLQIPVIISVPLAVDPNLSTEPLSLHLKMLATALLITIHIETWEDFRTLILVMAASTGALGVKFGLYGLMQGGTRFSDGYGGMLSDNNNIALAFAMSVPLCWFARRLVENPIAKAAFMFMTFNLIGAVVMTHSRGGAVALIISFLVVVYFSKRRLLVLTGLSVMTAIFITLVADTYFERMETLEDPTQERSAESRILFAQAAIKMWLDYPIVGVGFGGENQRALQQSYLPPLKDPRARRPASYIHNTYLEYLTGSGILAFALYVGLLVGTLLWLWGVAKTDQMAMEGGEVIPVLCLSSLVAFAVGSTFLSRQSFDLYFIMLAVTAAYRSIRKKHLEEVEHQEPEEMKENAEIEGIAAFSA